MKVSCELREPASATTPAARAINKERQDRGHYSNLSELGLTRLLPAVTAGAIYVLIVIGGYVSAVGAGLACPDWPLCQGQVLPPLTPAIAAELTHRFFTIAAGVLVLATTAMVWIRLRWVSKIVASATLCLGLLIAQVLLGMVTIQSQLQPAVVTAHLGLAMSVFATAILTAVWTAGARPGAGSSATG